MNKTLLLTAMIALMCFPVLTHAQASARGANSNAATVAASNTAAAAPTFGSANTVSSSESNGGAINTSVQFFPNPFASTLNVSIGNNGQNAGSKLFLYNSQGALLMSTVLTDMISSYPMNNFPNGVYYYRVIRLNGEVQSGRLVAKHQY